MEIQASDHPELNSPRYVRDRDLSKNFYESGKATPGCLPGTFRPEVDHPPKDPLRSFLPGEGHGTSTATVMMSDIGHADGTVHPATAAFPEDDADAFVSGVAPEAHVIPFRVTNSVILTDTSDAAIAKTIHHCIGPLRKRNPPIDVAVMSISLGRLPWFWIEDKIKKALIAAREAGIVICAAAGQAFRFQKIDPAFPASDPNVICVGACDHNYAKFKKGFYGPAIDITAPGVAVWRGEARRKRGSPPEFVVNQSEGTSYAAAITAGACALWQAYHGRDYLIATYERKWIVALFRHCLKSSAHKPSGTWDTAKQGAGVLDAEALLKLELPDKAFIQSLGPTR